MTAMADLIEGWVHVSMFTGKYEKYLSVQKYPLIIIITWNNQVESI